jgi:hypothetical protein
MTRSDAPGTRLGAGARGASAALFSVFPFVRPFFPMDVFSRTGLVAAAPALADPAWVGAHLALTLAFVLLIPGLLGVYATLAESPLEPRARRALIASLLGIGLVLPTLGLETYAMPVIARAHLDGATGIAHVLGPIYRGPAVQVLLVGLGLLAYGAIVFARTIRRSGVLPGWAAVMFATGLTLWLPMLPRPIRIVDGLLIGIGGITLAWRMWRHARDFRTRWETREAAPLAPRFSREPGAAAGYQAGR